MAGQSAIDRISLTELLANPPLDQLHHTSWGPREGLIGPVFSLAQTTDGYLWLGTDRGLLRFDGVRFESFESLSGETMPGKAVLSLYATPDNGLWVGFMRGEAAFVRNGHVLIQEKTRPGGFEGATRAFAREADGTVWVANTRGLFKRVGDGWQRMGQADGYPDPAPGLLTMSVALDGDANLWVDNSLGVWVKPAGQSRFVPAPTPGRIGGYMAVDPQGRIWVNVRLPVPGGPSRMRYYRMPRPNVPGDAFDTGYPVHSSQYMPLFDRAGQLWYGAQDGVSRERLPTRALPEDQEVPKETLAAPPVPLVPWVPAIGAVVSAPPVRATSAVSAASSAPGGASDGNALILGVPQPYQGGVPALQRLTPSQRLTGDQVMRVLQDREGSIWIGTNGGLDRLRPTRVSLVQFPVGMSAPAMAAGPGGALWFTSRNGMFRLDPAGQGPDLVSYPVRSPSVSRVFVDHAGTVWLGDRNGLSRLRPDGAYIEEGPEKELGDWKGTIKDMAEDTSGTLWIASQFMGLLRRFSDGRWERLSGVKGFPANSAASTIAVDERGRVWLGYNDGLLLRVEPGDRITSFGEKEGLCVGGVLAIAARQGYLWIGGDRGVQRLDDSGFHDLRAAPEDALNGVSGLVETPGGDLWLNGAAGITRIGAADLKRALAEPGYQVPLMQLDTSDGLPGRAETSWPLRTALQAPDGRLWFTVTNGVVTVAPEGLKRTAMVPSIDIQRVVVNGAALRPGADGQVLTGAGTRDLQIDYTALTLAMPERVRFKYRLRGLETAWHDAGTRRQAFYTNLGPGRYTFEVQATNAEGVWSQRPATLPIEIPPTFVQSIGFRALCALLVLIVVAVLVRLRLRQVEARALERYRARLEERNRIAQDLHDTLLQGFQGLLLRFQRVAWSIPKESPARAEMERVLDQADEVVIDGRDRVTDLRQPPADAGPLDKVLEALGKDLAGYHDSVFRISVSGTPRALDAAVHTEVALVAREGLFNAFQHSKAACIEVRLDYGDTAFTLTVSDDGVGVPLETQSHGRLPGHWGLSGMRERVQRVGGSFELRSPPGVGTEILVSIPAAQAYPRADELPRIVKLQRRLRLLLSRVVPAR